MEPPPAENSLPQSGYLVQTPFTVVYERFGSRLLGEPISGLCETASGGQAQYFQTMRLELSADGQTVSFHPLGEWAYGGLRRKTAAPLPDNSRARLFEESGFEVRDEFLEFYERNDGESLLGEPISPQLDEGTLRVQYFRNGRMEWRPDAPIADVDLVSTLIMPPPAFRANVSRVDTNRLDQLLGRPGLTREALGDEAGLAVVGATSGPGRPLVYEFTLLSPRLEARGALVERADRFELAAPLSASWEAPGPWLNAVLLAPEADAKQPQAITFASAVPLRAEVRSLSLGKEGLFAAGAFTLDARLSAARVDLTTSSSELIALEGVDVTGRRDPSATHRPLPCLIADNLQHAWRASAHQRQP